MSRYRNKWVRCQCHLHGSQVMFLKCYLVKYHSHVTIVAAERNKGKQETEKGGREGKEDEEEEKKGVVEGGCGRGEEGRSKRGGG